MSNEIEIIENTDEAKDRYDRFYGESILELTNEHITALKQGKCLATNDGEYSTFIVWKNGV